MNEHFWLTLCFIIFWIMAIKPIYKACYAFLKNAQDLIILKIKDAQNIYTQASEKLEEANALQKELDNAIIYIHTKAKEAIDYDLEIRAKTFEKTLLIKSRQAENQIEREANRYKTEMLIALKDKLHSKFILYFHKHKNQANEFTDLMLKK